MDIKRKIKELVESEGFDRAVRLGQWKDWDLYVADSDEPCDVGLPQYILVSDQEVRWATYEESEEIMSSLS